MSGYTQYEPAGIIRKAQYQLPRPEGVTASEWMQNGDWYEGGVTEMMAHYYELGLIKEEGK